MSYGLTFSDEPRESVERVRREQLESAVQSLETGDHAAVLRQLADDEWPLRRALDADALADSLKSTYVRGRAAFERADREPTTTNLHEWRKRVKDLWYQQRLLEDTWPGVMKAQAKEAKTLSKLLGEDHDLAMLAEHVDDEALHVLIGERRAELLAAARDLGRRVHAERPKAFARRSQRYVELAA